MLNIQKASAGSGKTYTLVKEYIMLLLGYKDENGVNRLHSNKVREAHRAILAVTFTNKATNEMKQRIVQELAVLSSRRKVSESPYVRDLCGYFNTTEEDLSKVAEKALWELLHDFTSFNISTLDSFFQNILRTFAREAEVTYSYDIELHDEYAVRVGVNSLVSSLSRNSGKENRQLHNWLKLYMRNQVEKGNGWNIFSDSSGLFNLAKQLNTELFKRHREELKEYLSDKERLSTFQKELSVKIDSSIKQKYEVAVMFRNLLDECALPLDGLNKNGHINGFTKITDKEDISLPPGFYKINEDCGNWFKKAVARPEDLSYDFVQQIIKFAERIYEIEMISATYDAMRQNLFALGLLGDIDKNIENFRKENDLILLSDTNELLKKIISEEDTPFIYERVGIWLKHFLIDEFQDTSKLQWVNMKPLLSESLANSHESLIIGDEKQSIYRFRNADPSLLQDQVFIDFKGRIANSDTIDRCSTNWRSAENIVKFNNTLFSLLPEIIEQDCSSPKISKTYSNVIQLIASKKKGYVKIEFVDNEDDKKWNEVVLERIPHIVSDCLNRGYRQQDIAILVNRNDEGASVIDSLLNYSEKKLNVVSDESLLLKNSPAIRLIISILKYLDNSLLPKSNHEEGVEGYDGDNLKSIPVILQRFESGINNGKTPSESLSECFDVHNNAVDKNPLNLLNAELTSLVSITEAIIKQYIKPEAFESENAYIQAFQDIVIDFTAHSPSSIHSFLKWWEAHSANRSITSPAGIDAINVMTIHKSKGLEFPCVIIPFCDWGLNKGSNWLWSSPKLVENFPPRIVPPIIPLAFSKQLDATAFRAEYQDDSANNIVDTLNKTYVAFTRAADELMIFAPQSPTAGTIAGAILPALYSATIDKVQVIKDSLSEKCDTPDPGVVVALNEYILSESLMEIGTAEEVVINSAKAEKRNDSTTFVMESYIPSDTIKGLKYNLPDTLNENPRTKGMLYHKMLSMIRYESDLSHVIARSKAYGILTEDEAENVIAIITDGLQNEEVRTWFAKDNRVLNERTISKSGETYRPDRIIVTPAGETVVIDYKFGERHSKSHITQLLNYISIIREAGHTSVVGKLWYPLENHIETFA